MWRKLADVFFWLGLSLYFGGLMTLGVIVAPAVFSTTHGAQVSMPGIVSPPLDMGNQVGGEIFGAALNHFAYAEAAALGLMFLGFAGWMLGHKFVRRSTWVLLTLWTLVALLAGYDSTMLRPKVWAQRDVVRQQAAAHVADGPTVVWPDRAEFDSLHDWSETVARIKGYALLAMVLVAAWRGLAEKRGASVEKSDVMRRTMAADKPHEKPSKATPEV